jgi:hypothetical protein
VRLNTKPCSRFSSTKFESRGSGVCPAEKIASLQLRPLHSHPGLLSDNVPEAPGSPGGWQPYGHPACHTVSGGWRAWDVYVCMYSFIHSFMCTCSSFSDSERKGSSVRVTQHDGQRFGHHDQTRPESGLPLTSSVILGTAPPGSATYVESGDHAGSSLGLLPGLVRSQ